LLANSELAELDLDVQEASQLAFKSAYRKLIVRDIQCSKSARKHNLRSTYKSGLPLIRTNDGDSYILLNIFLKHDNVLDEERKRNADLVNPFSFLIAQRNSLMTLLENRGICII
jgi:hypothetical protein